MCVTGEGTGETVSIWGGVGTATIRSAWQTKQLRQWRFTTASQDEQWATTVRLIGNFLGNQEETQSFLGWKRLPGEETT
jgi:hypothetical protein